MAAFGSAQWDITDPAAATTNVRPGDVVVNCAAYTDVDAAETDPQTAHAVNALGPRHLATACARAGARLIHLSTDYVFGAVFGAAGGAGSAAGNRPYRPEDPTGPVNVYGRTKLAGEHEVLAALPAAQVVRTAWVYTGADGGRDFVAVLRRLAAGTGSVPVVADQIGSPTFAGDLVGALLALIDETGAPGGIRHAVNAGAVSRYEQAREAFALLGVDPDRVCAVSTAEFPRPAPRPAYSALATVGVPMLRGWRAALAAALRGGPLSSKP